MKKTLCAALAAFMAVTLVSGCQKEGTTSTKKTELLLGLPGGNGTTAWDVVENFKAAYADKYEIETDEASWNDFTQKIKLQFVAKNDVVPVFFTDSMQATTFGAQGAVLDLKEWVDKELDADLYSNALYAITDADGHLWGVPHAINPIAVIYNKEIFDERGIAYPEEDWTFDEMLSLAKELTFDRDGDGKTDVYGIDYQTKITQGWLPFMSAVGVSPYKDNFRNSNLDDPKVKEAMEKYYQPIADGLLMSPSDMAAFGGFAQAFAQGKIAMGIVQASGIHAIPKYAPELDYALQIMPFGWNGERPCIYVPNTWQVYAGVEEDVKAGALDWLKHYLSEESQMIIAEKNPSGFPIMKKALESMGNYDNKPENVEAFYKGIDEYGMTLLENPASSSTRTIVDEMTNKIYYGEDIDRWIETSHTDMQRELDFFYESRE